MAFAHHHLAHLPTAHVGGDIHRHPLALEARKIFAQRCPVTGQSVLRQIISRTGRNRPGGLASPQDFGGHTLTDLALRIAVDQQGKIRVAVQVDETGSDNQALGVDHAARRGIDQPSHVSDLAVLDGHAPLNPRASTAINDVAVNDQQVELRFFRPRLADRRNRDGRERHDSAGQRQPGDLAARASP